MCGVFGFLSTGKAVDLDHLAEIAVATERRGRHAHGLAWIDSHGRLRRYKAAGPISDDLGCLDFLQDARMVIGHCRWATHGAWSDNGNNHPHSADGGWIVHNGMVYNHAALAARYSLPTVSACDSEVLGLLVEELRGTLVERCARALERAEGPQVLLGLWSRPARLVVARRGKPLHVASGANGGVYFGSLPRPLNDPDRILDNTVRVYTVRDGRVFQTIEEIEPCRKRNPEVNPSLGRPLRRYDASGKASGRLSLDFE